MDLLNPDGKRLRQEQEYVYHVYASVNLTEVRAVYGLADDAFFAAASDESVFSLAGPRSAPSGVAARVLPAQWQSVFALYPPSDKTSTWYC